MSGEHTAPSAAARAGHGARRMAVAFRALPPERRLAAYAAGGLILSLFLPWYQRQFFTIVNGHLLPASDSQTAWGAFSFVEAAVLVVAAGVLTLLFQRAEGRAFHLPGGDGWVITAAGAWTCVLVIWRIFDRQGGTAHGADATTYGIRWGIFVALCVAGFLTYAGSRIRAAQRPEPPLPGEGLRPSRSPVGAPSPSPVGAPSASPVRAPASPERSRPRPRPAATEDPAEAPTVRRRPRPQPAGTEDASEAPTVRRRPRLSPPADQPTDEQLTIPFDADG
jgi:hypothetical protein